MLKDKAVVRGIITSVDEAHNGVLLKGKDRILVRNALVKEEVEVVIRKRIREGYIGDIKRIIKPSPQRVVPPCPIYERCGSCQLQHVSLQGQKEYKDAYIRKLCQSEKSLHLHAQSILSMEEPWAYRNKMIIGFQKDKKHRIQAGFYEEFSHKIIPYRRCLLHPEACDAIVQTIVALMEKFRIEPYEEDKRRGLLRHVLLRYGAVSKEIMVVLVVNSNVFPARKQFVQALRQAHPEITTIVQNVNSRKTSVVLGDEERVLYGPGFIKDTLCGLQFRISAKSFYQINHAQTEVLYKRAIAMLKLKGTERILDAYCGIGTIGMYASSFAKEVIGVEINQDAVADAKRNAAANGVKNIRFVCGDASVYMARMAKERQSLDVVIMDPPRSGSTPEFIRSAASVKPKQILYISCNPQTQIRDLKEFAKVGYRVQGEMVPIDLFPFTNHVESVVLMTHQKG